MPKSDEAEPLSPYAEGIEPIYYEEAQLDEELLLKQSHL